MRLDEKKVIDKIREFAESGIADKDEAVTYCSHIITICDLIEFDEPQELPLQLHRSVGPQAAQYIPTDREINSQLSEIFKDATKKHISLEDLPETIV